MSPYASWRDSNPPTSAWRIWRRKFVVILISNQPRAETEVSSKSQDVEALIGQKYRHGFVTDIESDSLPPGLDEDVVGAISKKKHEPEFLLKWRLKAVRHWPTMKEHTWAPV